jgi:proliferating cell nuclear antigen
MFKAVTKDSKLLRDSIDTISQLIDDGLFMAGKDGMKMMAADRAMVSFVDFRLKASAFDEYECDSDVSIGLNMINFLTILKRANSNDKLTLTLNDNDNKLDVILQGDSRRKFSIPLIEISKEDMPQIDQLKFGASAKVRADILEQGITDADIVADSVMIGISPESMRMSAEGTSSKAEMNLEKGNEALSDLEASEDVSSRYSLEYLKKMIKGSRISDIVKVNMGKDFPLKLDFVGENASLSLVLAPRIADE